MTDLAEVIRELVRAEVRTALADRHAVPVAPRFYSIAASAAALDLSRAAFYNLLGRGEIRTVHIGRRQLVPEAELARYIARRGAS